MVKKTTRKKVSKKNEKRKILVLGAGYAGISVVQTLARNLDDVNYEIVLVDKYDCHVFQGELYEVATAVSSKIKHRSLPRLKETVATPVQDMIDTEKIKFMREEVLEINPNMRQVKFKSKKTLDYDYLVLCLGSSTNFYGIKGMKENARTLKTVEDALRINCELDQFMYHLWDKQRIEDVDVVVGGGGAAGVELAGELRGYMDALCSKYGYPKEKVKIVLIEGGDSLAKLNKRGSRMILNRLRKLGVEVHLDSLISRLTKNSVELQLPKEKRKVLPHDFFIWTGGVMVNPVVAKSFGKKRTKGGIEVNPLLQSINYRNVFAAGDNTYLNDPKAGAVPMLAQVAWVEGVTLANNLIALIKGEAMEPYKIPEFHWLVPVGGKFAIWQSGDKIRSGFWVWALKRLIYFRYYMHVLPFWKAWHKFFHSTRIFAEND